LEDVSLASDDEIIAALAEIVAAKGPIHARRADQLYTKAAGGHRVGREMRGHFNKAVNRALRRNQLVQIRDDLTGQVDKTLHRPQGSPVLVRELGPRQIHEVPRSELATLITELGVNGEPSRTKRAVLDALGLVKLTQKTSDYLDECLRYQWR
jgi:hypothetical protein